MARLFLILIALAFCVVFALILHSIWTHFIAPGAARLRPVLTQAGAGEMAPSGIQKAAYVALIIVLFGVASGWLGGL